MNKSILILGGASDIALACAYKFAENGYEITLAARNAEKLAAAKSDLEIKFQAKVKLQNFDAEKWSNQKTEILKIAQNSEVVLLAYGILGDHEKAKTDTVEFSKIIALNFTSAVEILQEIALIYENRKSGTIIGISSVAGERGRQSNYVYGSAKAGFSVFLDGLRNRLFASNVHVLNVKPGFVATKMTSHLPLPNLLTAQAEKVASDIYNAFLHKRNTIYTIWIWRYIMLIIKNIPEFIFKKLKL